MKENTLYLKHQPDGCFPNGLWTCNFDHVSQVLAMQHFSGGSIAVDFGRYDEIVYIAGLHGWNVIAGGVWA